MGRQFKTLFRNTHAACRISLWVDVKNQNLFAFQRQACSQVNIGGRLANAAFLIEDRYRFTHFYLLFFL
jgi:hypothetical protein